MGWRAPGGRGRTAFAAIVVACVAVAVPVNASEAVPPEIASRLTAAQLKTYEQYLSSRAAFDRQLEGYWSAVNARRDERRRKFQARIPATADDYVREQPPLYRGIPLPADIAKLVTDAKPPDPERQLPGVADFLSSARDQYGFVPTPTTDRQFKRAYAEEALKAGLTKDQVVRVYALETGGDGTYDMQAGISPLTKQGKPISSALGYAQLLHANSVNEIVKYGPQFINRLNQLAQQPNALAWRARGYQSKAVVLSRMLRAARSVPNEWSAHQRLGGTAAGLGIHALNLDADIGPWLQVLKLKGLLDTASHEAGRTHLSGAELELMNLAGPRTGLEMMTAVGRDMPTSNFFSQQGYYRNTIVREKTGAGLLAALEERMNVNLKKPGSIEFAAIFDEIQGRQPAAAMAPAPAAEKPGSIDDLLARTAHEGR
jgi:hypothetical protein